MKKFYLLMLLLVIGTSVYARKKTYRDTVFISDTTKYIGQIRLDTGDPRAVQILIRGYAYHRTVYADQGIHITMEKGQKYAAKKIKYNNSEFYVFLEWLKGKKNEEYQLYTFDGRFFVQHDSILTELEKENYHKQLAGLFSDDESLYENKEIALTRGELSEMVGYKNKGTKANVRKVQVGFIVGNSYNNQEIVPMFKKVTLPSENWNVGGFIYAPIRRIKNLGVSSQCYYGFNDNLLEIMNVSTGLEGGVKDLKVNYLEGETHSFNLSSEIQYGIRFRFIEPFLSAGGRFMFTEKDRIVGQYVDSEQVLRYNLFPSSYFGYSATIGVNIYYTSKYFIQAGYNIFRMNGVFGNGGSKSIIYGNGIHVKLGF